MFSKFLTASCSVSSVFPLQWFSFLDRTFLFFALPLPCPTTVLAKRNVLPNMVNTLLLPVFPFRPFFRFFVVVRFIVRTPGKSTTFLITSCCNLLCYGTAAGIFFNCAIFSSSCSKEDACSSNLFRNSCMPSQNIFWRPFHCVNVFIFRIIKKEALAFLSLLHCSIPVQVVFSKNGISSCCLLPVAYLFFLSFCSLQTKFRLLFANLLQCCSGSSHSLLLSNPNATSMSSLCFTMCALSCS